MLLESNYSHEGLDSFKKVHAVVVSPICTRDHSTCLDRFFRSLEQLHPYRQPKPPESNTCSATATHTDTYVGVGGDCVGIDLLDLPYQKLWLLGSAEVVFHKVSNLERQLQTVYSHEIE